MNSDEVQEILQSAYKHGVSKTDMLWVFGTALSGIVLSEEPEKVMFFGFDTVGRALEIGCERLPNQKWKIIHAMKLRKGYERYLEGWKEFDPYDKRR